MVDAVPACRVAFPDRDGSLASEEVLSLARNSGATHAVVGKLELLRDQGRGTRVATTLGVLKTSSGKAMGEIHKEYPLGEASNQEKAMELASLVVPQLDRFLMESSIPDESFQPTPPRTMGVSGPSKGEGLTLQIRSNRPQADWEEMEKMLREQFKSMQIMGLEFTPGGGVVRLDGVDSSFLNSLNGTRLQEGALLKVENSSTDGNGLIVTVTHPGSSQSNQ